MVNNSLTNGLLNSPKISTELSRQGLPSDVKNYRLTYCCFGANGNKPFGSSFGPYKDQKFGFVLTSRQNLRDEK